MSKILKSAVCLMLCLMLCGCLVTGVETTDNKGKSSSNKKDSEGVEANLLSGKYSAEIVVEGYGTIKLTLDADNTPITVTNFKKLSDEGFYDGLTFHRIMDGFMIQGGCPEGTGYGGAEKTIKGEFLYNGVKNNISHKRGVISMARSQNSDSASSQFFIVQKDSDFLDGKYAAFGYVTEGIEIVDKICKDVIPTDNNGTVPKKNQPTITTIRVYK